MSFNKTDDSFCRRWSKKIYALNKLGGKCSKCGSKDIFSLNFHHIEKKEKDVYRLFTSDAKLEEIDREIEKCIVLCRNCHTLEHYSSNNPVKVRLLQIKGNFIGDEFYCQECGFKSKNSFVFDFHHVTGEKKFIINYACRMPSSLTFNFEKVLLEIDKCKVLCANCHAIVHSAREKFEKFREKIETKFLEGPKNQEVSRDKIIKMFESGLYASQIAREIGCGTTTISRVLKNSGCYDGFKKNGTKKFYVGKKGIL